jgi:hypothetical protein
MARKRKLSSTSIDAMDGGDRVSNGHAPGPAAESKLTSTIKSFFESIAGSGSDPTNTVVNGATIQSKPLLARVLADIASQAPRIGENLGLVHSLVDTTLFDGGLVDDRQYQVRQPR